MRISRGSSEGRQGLDSILSEALLNNWNEFGVRSSERNELVTIGCFVPLSPVGRDPQCLR